MMSSTSVQVWNDYKEDHKETLQDESIVIPANSYIEMPRAKALRLVSQMTPVYRAGETNTPPKRLRIHDERKAERARLDAMSRENSCMMCEQSFNTSRELDVHVEMNHADSLIDKEEGLKNVKKRKR